MSVVTELQAERDACELLISSRNAKIRDCKKS